MHTSMDTYDPQRDYERQPSWSPITPTSPTGQMGFPEQNAFDVHASVDDELSEKKAVTTDASGISTLDGSSERIILGTNTRLGGSDHEVNHIWNEMKRALRKELKDELISELRSELEQELRDTLRKEIQNELLQSKQHDSKTEAQVTLKTEEGVPTQQHTKPKLFDPFAPVLLGPVRPGCEDGDARAIAELDEAMKEVDERMARMDEEMERKFGREEDIGGGREE